MSSWPTDSAESIILIPGGFAEAGETGLAAAIERTLADGHARAGGGPVMVGGNCLGIVSRDHYNTFFLPLWKLPFRPGRGENLAIVSQSGAYLVTFASNYDGLIHPRASISFGNQMDLTVADFLLHFLDEPAVDVIACYVEGFRPGDGGRFLDAARQAAARGKRVIVFKAGKTALGAKAAASHTASLAGDYAIARGCLEAAGVAVAETLDEFEDLIKTFTLLAGKEMRGRRVGVLSNAGFECSTVTDALGELQLAEFDAATRAVLDEALPPFAHRDNPVDATPMAATTAYARSVGGHPRLPWRRRGHLVGGARHAGAGDARSGRGRFASRESSRRGIARSSVGGHRGREPQAGGRRGRFRTPLRSVVPDAGRGRDARVPQDRSRRARARRLQPNGVVRSCVSSGSSSWCYWRWWESASASLKGALDSLTEHQAVAGGVLVWKAEGDLPEATDTSFLGTPAAGRPAQPGVGRCSGCAARPRTPT